MVKYNEETKTKCVNAVKGFLSGKLQEGTIDGKNVPLKSLKDIQRAFGPNPLATKRYCKKAGVDTTKVPNKIPPKKQETPK